MEDRDAEKSSEDGRDEQAVVGIAAEEPDPAILRPNQCAADTILHNRFGGEILHRLVIQNAVSHHRSSVDLGIRSRPRRGHDRER